MRIKILIATVLMSLCSAAYSDCSSTGQFCQGIGKQAVQTATVTQTGVLFMVPSGANLGPCTLVGGQYIQLLDSHPHFKEIYSTYLTAIATNQYFLIAVDNSTNCTVAYIRTWNS